MSDKLFKTITDAEAEFKPLFERMDADRKLYLLDDYKFTYLQNGSEVDVPNGISLTMNQPQVFVNSCMAILSSADMQTVVEGEKLNDDATNLIENFFNDMFISVDEALCKRDFSTLFNFLSEQILVRGRIASRNIIYKADNGTWIPNILPCDTRYLVYEYDEDSLSMACYQTNRTAAGIIAQYPEAKNKLKSKSAIVRDYWDKESNVVYVDNNKIKEVENVLGYPPFVVQLSGAGSMLMDKESVKYRGESVLAQNRTLWNELNRMASVLQTLNMMSFGAGWQYASEAGEQASKPENPHGLFKVIPIEKGGGYNVLPFNDIHNAARLFYTILMSAIQQGSLPSLDYGNLTFPLSALAISRLTQTKDKIFIPRLDALARYYQATSRQMLDQYIRGNDGTGITAELGAVGKKKTYKASDFDKEFSISYKFYSTSPEQDIANYSIAQQARNLDLLSDDTILRDIIKVKNPNGEREKKRAEKAERGDVAISLYRLGHSLIEEGEIDPTKLIEAELVLQQLEVILRNRAGGGMAGINLSSQSRQLSTQPQSGLPLFGGGAPNTGQPNQPEQEIAASPAVNENSAARRAEVVRNQGGGR